MQIRENEPLYSYNTYRTGGEARYFTTPETVDELSDVLMWAHVRGIPHELIGYGANILVSDKGYGGLIVCLRNFEKWVVTKGSVVIAGAGALLNDVVQCACDEGLGGMENLAGIPGTVGGAARMNAGAFGTEMKDVTGRINVMESRSTQVFELSRRIIDVSEVGFGYRRADGLNGRIVTAVEFALTPSACGELNSARRAVLERRAEKQPLNLPSCGSVFKRPESGSAGELIERCGLKKKRIGGAFVSEKHANFILNSGTATSGDIYKLIQHIKYSVLQKYSILLEEELRYLGEFAYLLK